MTEALKEQPAEKQERDPNSGPYKVMATRPGEYPPGHRRRKGDIFLIKKLAHKGKWMIEENEKPPAEKKPDFMKGQAPTSRFKSTEARKHMERTLDDEARERKELLEQEQGLTWEGQEPEESSYTEDEETGEITLNKTESSDGGDDVSADQSEPAEEGPSVYSKPPQAQDNAPGETKDNTKKLTKYNRKGLTKMKRPQLAKIAKEKGVSIQVGMTNEKVVDAILTSQDKEFKNTFERPEIRRA